MSRETYERHKILRICAQHLPFLLNLLVFYFAIYLGWATQGTNDAFMWESSARLAVQIDGIDLYRNLVDVHKDGQLYYKEHFNHPPFMITFLRIIWQLSQALEVPFVALFRSVIAFFHFVGFFFISGTTTFQQSPLISRALIAIAPVPLLVAGFHANSDPMMICYLLASAWALENRRSPVCAGILFGMALNTKLVALFFIPSLFFYLRGSKRLSCIGSMLITAFLPWTPYLMTDPMVIITKTLGYASLTGIWGISFLGKGSFAYSIIEPYIRYVLAAIIVFVSWLANRYPARPPLLIQWGFSIHLFLFLAPGFGIQYLAWLSPWLATMAPQIIFYSYLCQGAFQILLYTFWSRGIPWDFADSITSGPWNDLLISSQLAAWISVGITLLAFTRKLYLMVRSSKQMTQTSEETIRSSDACNCKISIL